MGNLLFIEPLFLALYNLGPQPLEELTEKNIGGKDGDRKLGGGRQPEKMKRSKNQVDFSTQYQGHGSFSQFWPLLLQVMNILNQ